MSDANFMFQITPIPLVSVVVWVVLGFVALYLARRPFHQFMETIGRLIYNAMRMTAAALKMSRRHLETLNRDVLLNAGIEASDQKVRLELDRIADQVKNKLGSYPQLERQIKEHLLAIKADYQQSAEIPQALSNWANVIEAIAAIQPAGDPMVIQSLDNINKTLENQYSKALQNHRRDVSTRHGILSRMIPRWDLMERRLKQVDTTINRLTQQCVAVDRCAASLETACSCSRATEKRLRFSFLAQFFTSGLMLGIYLIGTIITFFLIAPPMAEMVGGTTYLKGIPMADLAAMVMIALQVSLGVLLMDAAGVTRLFDRIYGLNEKKRLWIFWSILAILLILAGVESSMVFIRDRVASDMQALKQSLSGLEPPSMTADSIVLIGQMVFGFLVPLVTATSAIPLESFIRSSRIVLGMVSVWTLQALTLFVRLIGSLGYHTCRLVTTMYDIVIFPAIWAEAWIQRKAASEKTVPKTRANRFVGHATAMNMVKETVVCKKTSD